MPCSQNKKKILNRNNIVTNSIKTLKMVHIKQGLCNNLEGWERWKAGGEGWERWKAGGEGWERRKAGGRFKRRGRIYVC